MLSSACDFTSTSHIISFPEKKLEDALFSVLVMFQFDNN